MQEKMEFDRRRQNLQLNHKVETLMHEAGYDAKLKEQLIGNIKAHGDFLPVFGMERALASESGLYMTTTDWLGSSRPS